MGPTRKRRCELAAQPMLLRVVRAVHIIHCGHLETRLTVGPGDPLGGGMDIHKPKPWRGLREFLKEYLIIVVGVLTALAGEQLVEAIRWDHEAARAREALGQEIAYDLKALGMIAQEDPCITRRIDGLNAWAEAKAAKPLGATRPPIFFSMQTSTWEAANASQVIAHLPLRAQLAYALTYSRLANQKSALDQERTDWAQAVAITNMPRADAQDMRALERAVGLAKFAQVRRASNSLNLERDSRPLTRPGPGPRIVPGAINDPAGFCDGAELPAPAS